MKRLRPPSCCLLCTISILLLVFMLFLIPTACRLFLPFPLSLAVSLERLPEEYLELLGREGGILYFPGRGGGVESREVKPGERVLSLPVEPGSWIPVELRLKGGGPPAGGVIWKDLSGPGGSPPHWERETSASLSFGLPLTLSLEGGGLSGLLLSLLEYREDLAYLDLDLLFGRMVDSGTGDPGAVDLTRLRSDLVRSLQRGSTGSGSVLALPREDGELWIDVPESLGLLWLIEEELFPLRPEALSPLFSGEVEMYRDGRIVCSGFYPGQHRFLFRPKMAGGEGPGLDLLISCESDGRGAEIAAWRLLLIPPGE